VANPQRTKAVVEKIVAEVWARYIWPPFRPLIAARLDSIRLGTSLGIYWQHQGQRLMLSVTDWVPEGAWEQEMRFAVGQLLIYALLLEVAAIASGANAQTGTRPAFRQGAPAAGWFVTLQPRRRNEVAGARQIMRQMAAAIINACGLHHPKPQIDVSKTYATDMVVTDEWDAENEEEWYE
jgi:hypothetical protein